MNTTKRYLIAIAFFYLLSCNRIDCKTCDNNLSKSWTYDLKTGSNSYNDIEKSGKFLFFQDRNKNTIVKIDGTNGLSEDLLKYNSTDKYESNQYYNIQLSVGGNLLVYENVIDANRSNLIFFEFKKRKVCDTVNITTDRSYAAFKSDIKLSFKPLITNSMLIYGLNDGTLHCYNTFLKSEAWTKKFNGALILSKPIVVGGNVIFNAYKDNTWNKGSLVLSLSIADGHLVWQNYIDNLKLPLVSIKNTLLGITEDGKFMNISLKTGKTNHEETLLSEPVALIPLGNTGFIAISNLERKLIIYDFLNSRVLKKYTTSNLVYEMDYSVKSNKIVLQDLSGQTSIINLKSWSSLCLSNKANTFSQFVLKSDSLFFNNTKSIFLTSLSTR